MRSLEVRTPVQLQLRIVTKPIIYMPLSKLEINSDGCFTKIMPIWSPIIYSPIMLVLEKPPIIPKLC